MIRRMRLLWIASIPTVLTVTAFLALASAEPSARPAAAATPQPSSCVPALSKAVDPASILLGEDTKATLVVSGTCAAKFLPIDLVILADDSNSMGVLPSAPGLETPIEPPGTPPNPLTPPTPPVPPTPGGSGTSGEPPFCRGGGAGPTTAPSPNPPRTWGPPSPPSPPP